MLNKLTHHATARCNSCGWANDWYITALESAQAHVVETGHTVTCEEGSAIRIHNNTPEMLRSVDGKPAWLPVVFIMPNTGGLLDDDQTPPELTPMAFIGTFRLKAIESALEQEFPSGWDKRSRYSLIAHILEEVGIVAGDW